MDASDSLPWQEADAVTENWNEKKMAGMDTRANKDLRHNRVFSAPRLLEDE